MAELIHDVPTWRQVGAAALLIISGLIGLIVRGHLQDVDALHADATNDRKAIVETQKAILLQGEQIKRLVDISQDEQRWRTRTEDTMNSLLQQVLVISSSKRVEQPIQMPQFSRESRFSGVQKTKP